MDITRLEGTGGETGATQFHAWVTNPFKYARCIARSLASILLRWRSNSEALSPLSARIERISKTDECQEEQILPTKVKIGCGPSSRDAIIRISSGRTMSEGGVYTETTGNRLPGCSSRDMICEHPLAKKIEFMTHNEFVSRHSQTDFTHREATIAFKEDFMRRKILNIVDERIDCLANGNPVEDCNFKKLKSTIETSQMHDH